MTTTTTTALTTNADDDDDSVVVQQCTHQQQKNSNISGLSSVCLYCLSYSFFILFLIVKWNEIIINVTFYIIIIIFYAIHDTTQ